jgi:phosphoribosylformylglycinamidine synthase
MAPGDVLLLVGETRGELGSSLYLREILGREDGAPPPVDLATERRNGDFVRGLIARGEVQAVHDLSDGGLAVAAAEMAMASGVGVSLDPQGGLAPHGFLFGEDQARYLLAVRGAEAILASARAAGVCVAVVGEAGGDGFAADGLFDIPVARLTQVHEAWMPRYMEGAPGA